jgi:hypothetical protein
MTSGIEPYACSIVPQPTTLPQIEYTQDKFGTAGNAAEIPRGYSSNTSRGVLTTQQLSRCLHWRRKRKTVTIEHCVLMSHAFAVRRRGGNLNTVRYSRSNTEIRDSVIKFVAFNNSFMLSFACSRGGNGTVLTVYGNNRSQYEVSRWLVTCSVLG